MTRKSTVTAEITLKEAKESPTTKFWPIRPHLPLGTRLQLDSRNPHSAALGF